ncbi:LamG-like jellyroll fold domain-containing protein, partial [Flammeovirga sp. OC4]|uniref:LamG-like jellyroll fold domain-containing protein n=1 Tax=Flammeovirga sp. OC4 TaxID=1382345 RepID=UPI0005C6FEFE
MKLLQTFIGILILLIPLRGMTQGDPIVQLLFDQATPTNTGTETNIVFNDLGGFTYQQSDEQRAAFASVSSSNKGITFKTLEGTNYPIASGNAARSFSFWIKPKVLTGTQSLIYTGAGSGTIFTLQLTNQGKIKLADNGGNWVAAQTILEVDQWAHVTVTLKESIGIHDVEFYINGMPSTVGTSGSNNIINTNTGVFKIFGTLTADVADFRYYNKHLDFIEVFNVFGQKELLLDVVTNESVLSDRSPNNYAFSVLSGVPTTGFDDVDLGSVLSADGAVITASDFRGVEGATPRTVLFWYKQKEGAEATDKLSYYGSENNKFDLQIRNNTSFRYYNFYSTEQGGSYLAVNEEIDFSVWRHIAIVTNGETVDDVKIYIDGVEKDIDLTNATVTAINTTLAGDFRIANAAQGYFNSYKVYKGALSGEEVKADFEEVKFNQTITFDALPAVDTRTKKIELLATASSGLEVTFESSNPSVATIEGSTVTIIGAGETIIKASQLGNDRYKEAIEVTQKLLVTQYIPEVDPLLDFAFSENVYDPAFINTGVRSEVSLSANESGGAGITLGAFDEDKGQVLGVSMEQGTGSLIFKENGGNYSGVTGTDARTYSAWIKPNDLSEFNTIFYAGIDEGEKTSLSVQVLPTGAIKLVAGGNIVTTEAYHFIENQWNHIVVSIPNESMLSDIQMYINGALAETVVTNDRLFNTAPATLAIANKFWGLFSDFKYYERAISDEEAMDLYASTVFMHRINFNLPTTLAVRESVEFLISTTSNLDFEYSISDPTKIKIEEGKLITLEEGEVIIEATSFGVTSTHQLTITPYIPEEEPLLDFAFSENVYDPAFINTGVRSEVSLSANESGGAGITLGAFDEDKGQVLGVSMDQGTGSLIFKENGGNYSGVTGTAARTYSAWIKPNDLSEFNTIFYAGIDEGEKTSLSVQVLPTGAIKLVAGGNIVTTEAYHFIENQWNHIVVSIPNESMLSDIQMYINGALAETVV